MGFLQGPWAREALGDRSRLPPRRPRGDGRDRSARGDHPLRRAREAAHPIERRAGVQSVTLGRACSPRPCPLSGGRGHRTAQPPAVGGDRPAVLRKRRAGAGVRASRGRAGNAVLPDVDVQGSIPQMHGGRARPVAPLVRDGDFAKRSEACLGARRGCLRIFGLPHRSSSRILCRRRRPRPFSRLAAARVVLRRSPEMLLTICALLLAQAQPSEAAPSGVPGMAPVPGVPSLLQSGVPEVPRGLRERLDQYQNARAAALLDVLPDGSAALIATRFASTNQLHVVEHPMGARQQLTFGDEPISRGHLAPDGRAVYYLRDVGGGEFFQVYRLDRRSGRSKLLTDGKSRHQSLLLSHDGSGIAWASTARNGKDHDVYAGTTSSPKKVRRLTEREGSWEPADFSYDGKKLLVVQERAVDDADLHVVDLTTGEMRQLTPKEGKGSVAGAAFAPDGKSVYVATDRYGDFKAVWRIDLARIGEAPASTPFGRGQKWDVEDFAISPDGKLLAASINEDGWSRIYLAPANGGTPQALPLPKGLGGVLKFPEKRSDVLFIAQQTARSPTDVWSIDLKTKKPVRWTKSEVGGLDTDSFVEPELVRYPGKGGVSVPAFLWKPRTGGRVPVVIVWHGGPEGQSRPSFTPSSQFLANEMGIAV